MTKRDAQNLHKSWISAVENEIDGIPSSSVCPAVASYLLLASCLPSHRWVISQARVYSLAEPELWDLRPLRDDWTSRRGLVGWTVLQADVGCLPTQPSYKFRETYVLSIVVVSLKVIWRKCLSTDGLYGHFALKIIWRNSYPLKDFVVNSLLNKLQIEM